MVYNYKVCKYLVSNETNMSNFQLLEVVDCGSETQLHVGKKQVNGFIVDICLVNT